MITKWSILVLGFALIYGGSDVQAAPSLAIKDGAGGIGFDDLTYSQGLKRILVPAGRTGRLILVDPSNFALTPIDGFTRQNGDGRGHDLSVTSADEGRGLIYAIDRSSQKLAVVDPKKGTIVAAVPLAASPDYVRYVATTDEVWVTEPDQEQIEVFSLAASSEKPKSVRTIRIADGPESLVIDHVRKRAYTHLWHGKTVAISLETQKIVATWPNGCSGSRGIALDERNGLLFAGCSEGKAVVLAVASGQEISHLTLGSGVDVIDFQTELRHLYVPSAKSAELAILGVSGSGQLKLLGKEPTAAGAHCVTSDATSHAYVCLPHAGTVLVINDSWPRVD